MRYVDVSPVLERIVASRSVEYSRADREDVRVAELRDVILGIDDHAWEATALVQGERRLSYADFARLVWGFGRALQQDHGFRAGDRLAILAYNCPEWPIAAFGATSIGGIGVALNGWWQTEELEYALEDSGSRFLVVDERLYPRVADLIPKLPALDTLWVEEISNIGCFLRKKLI